MPLGFKPGHRVRASRRRLSPLRTSLIAVVAVVMSAVVGGIAYFIPAAQLAIESTGQVLQVTPSPSAAASPLASIHDKTVLMGSRTGIGKFNPQDGRSWMPRIK